MLFEQEQQVIEIEEVEQKPLIQQVKIELGNLIHTIASTINGVRFSMSELTPTTVIMCATQEIMDGWIYFLTNLCLSPELAKTALYNVETGEEHQEIIQNASVQTTQGDDFMKIEISFDGYEFQTFYVSKEADVLDFVESYKDLWFSFEDRVEALSEYEGSEIFSGLTKDKLRQLLKMNIMPARFGLMGWNARKE